MTGKTAARRAIEEIQRRRAADLPPAPIPPPRPAAIAAREVPPPVRRIVGDVLLDGLAFHVLDCTHIAAIDVIDLDRRADRRVCTTCHEIATLGAPAPAALTCPACGKAHVDEGRWATTPHRTHRCVNDAAGHGCGHTWTIIETLRGVLCGVCGNPHTRHRCVEARGEQPSCCCAPITEISARWSDDADFRRVLMSHETYLGAPVR